MIQVSCSMKGNLRSRLVKNLWVFLLREVCWTMDQVVFHRLQGCIVALRDKWVHMINPAKRSTADLEVKTSPKWDTMIRTNLEVPVLTILIPRIKASQQSQLGVMLARKMIKIRKSILLMIQTQFRVVIPMRIAMILRSLKSVKRKRRNSRKRRLNKPRTK